MMNARIFIHIIGIAAVLWCAALFPEDAAAQCAIAWNETTVGNNVVSTDAFVADYYGTSCDPFPPVSSHEYSVVIDSTCGAQYQQASNSNWQAGGGGQAFLNDTIVVTASPTCQINVSMTIWCSAIYAPILEVYDYDDVPIWTVSITDYNFNNPDPADDTVTVVTNGPGNGLLTVQATSNEDPNVTLYQETVGPNTHLIAFRPQGQSMPAGTWTGIAATFAQGQTSIPLTPVRVDTDLITIVSWVDESVHTLNSGANGALISNLNTPVLCSLLLGVWLAIPDLVYTSDDLDYANNWLLKNSANFNPGSNISTGYMNQGDYRMFNALRARFRRSVFTISDLAFHEHRAFIGATPDPCTGALFGADAHPYNGAANITNNSLKVVGVAASRVGAAGRQISYTLNGRTVPWIYTTIGFSGKAGSLLNHSHYPRHSIYMNNAFQTSVTPNLNNFIALDETSQPPNPATIP